MSRLFQARPAGLAYLCVFLLVPLAAGAVTWPVDPGGSIGAALDQAAYGDTVLVSCGLYQEQGLVLPDGVVLMADSGPPDCVTIATVGGESVLTVAQPGTASQVRGITFTVAGGGLTAQVVKGGGVLLEQSHAEFRDCRFLGLEAVGGGAVYVHRGEAEFYDCEFGNNRALASGGAVNCVDGGTVRMERCVFYGNTAAVTGSAVNAAAGTWAILVGCTLDDHEGTALASWYNGLSRSDRTIITGGDAAWVGDGNPLPSFECTDIWGNGSDWTGLLADQLGQDGNFSADPLFCPEGTSEFPYMLVSISPCAPAQNILCGLVGARTVGCDESVGIDDGPGDDPPDDGSAPAVTQLHASFPNPFNPHTTVRFDLRRAGGVRIGVYDLAGRLVRRLVDEQRTAGTHDVVWRGRNQAGRAVAAGVYFIRLEADGLIDTQRVALVK